MYGVERGEFSVEEYDVVGEGCHWDGVAHASIVPLFRFRRKSGLLLPKQDGNGILPFERADAPSL